jgi:hypothetical protein
MGARLEEVLRLRTTHEQLLRLLTREEVSYNSHFIVRISYTSWLKLQAVQASSRFFVLCNG